MDFLKDIKPTFSSFSAIGVVQIKDWLNDNTLEDTLTKIWDNNQILP